MDNMVYWTAMLYFSHITQTLRVNGGFWVLCANMFYGKLLGSHFHGIIYGKRYSIAITTFVPNTILLSTIRERPYLESIYLSFRSRSINANNHRYDDIVIEHIIILLEYRISVYLWLAPPLTPLKVSWTDF